MDYADITASITDSITACGGVNQVARALGVSPAAVSQWLTGYRRVPADHCVRLEALYPGRVRCEALRPDLPWAALRQLPD